jgi:AbrB family looped-hinge helix DNA binding protein
MNTTKLSSKGQIVLPSVIRGARQWPAGTEFAVIDTPEGVLLKPLAPAPRFAPTRLADIVGMAGYVGPRLSLADMDAAVAAEASRQRRRTK